MPRSSTDKTCTADVDCVDDAVLVVRVQDPQGSRTALHYVCDAHFESIDALGWSAEVVATW